MKNTKLLHYGSVLSLLALIALCLAWEIWLAPLRPGGSWMLLKALPLLARGSALRFLLTRLVDWFDVPAGALVRPKDPLEYYRKLRFHQTVEGTQDYGIAR